MENTYGAGLFLAPFVVRGFLYQFRFHIHQLLVSACVVHSIHLFLGSFVAAYDFRQSKLLPFLHSYVFHTWYVFFRMFKTFVTDYDWYIPRCRIWFPSIETSSFLHSYVFHTWYVFFRIFKTFVIDYDWYIPPQSLFHYFPSILTALPVLVCIPYPANVNFAAWKVKSCKFSFIDEIFSVQQDIYTRIYFIYKEIVIELDYVRLLAKEERACQKMCIHD